MLGLRTVARVLGEVRRDVDAVHDRDPAARGVGSLEVLALWPGVHALLAHRVAHALHGAGVPLVPRTLAALSRAATGIEIHPAARVGTGSSSTTASASSSARRRRSAATSRSTRA